jgi:hypothetical protein
MRASSGNENVRPEVAAQDRRGGGVSVENDFALNLDAVEAVRAGEDTMTSWAVLKSGRELRLSPGEAGVVIEALLTRKTELQGQRPEGQPTLSSGEGSSLGWIFAGNAG